MNADALRLLHQLAYVDELAHRLGAELRVGAASSPLLVGQAAGLLLRQLYAVADAADDALATLVLRELVGRGVGGSLPARRR